MLPQVFMRTARHRSRIDAYSESDVYSWVDEPESSLRSSFLDFALVFGQVLLLGFVQLFVLAFGYAVILFFDRVFSAVFVIIVVRNALLLRLSETLSLFLHFCEPA